MTPDPPHGPVGGRLAGHLVACMLLAGTMLAALGCQPYTIEYHRSRPSYYERLGADTSERVELPDGTILVYGDRDEVNPFQEDAESETFTIRYVDDDGNIKLRALLPQHVIANALNCVRLGEYELMWDELIAERTRLAYASEGLGFEDFAAFCEDNQVELARMLKRMLLGFMHYEVAVETLADGTIRCRFWPSVAQLFKFRTVEIVQEAFQLKLHVIY